MRPETCLFMVKCVIIYAVGIFSGLRVWSGKILQTWKNFYSKVCKGYRREAHV